jgi:hypothetical protein
MQRSVPTDMSTLCTPAPLPKRTRLVRLAFVAAAGAVSASAHALPPAGTGGTEPSWRTEFGAAYSHFDYREYDTAGRRIDSETGPLPGLVAAVAHSWGDWEARVAAAYFGRTVDYNGFSYNLTTQQSKPLETTTREAIAQVEGTVLRWLDNGPHRLGVYAGAGWRTWRRNIHQNDSAQASGQIERYTFGFFALGLRARLLDSARYQWWFDGRVTRTLSPALTIDAEGAFDNAELHPTSKFAYRLALPLDVRLRPGDTIRFEPFYGTWSLGASPGVPIMRQGVVLQGKSIYEPRSETVQSGLSISWVRQF